MYIALICEKDYEQYFVSKPNKYKILIIMIEIVILTILILDTKLYTVL